MKRLFFAIVLFLACGRHETRDIELSSDLRGALAAKVALYKSLLPEVQDANGFVATDKCDALLHSALVGVTVPVALEVAQLEPGRWFRRPLNYDECFAAGASRSTISRDMLLGVIWWAWKNGRLDVLEDLRSYGQAHDWIMGEADSVETTVSRTYLTPAFRGTLCRTARKMGGADHGDCYIPQVYPESLTDFEAHLQVLTILLEAEITGSLGSGAYGALQAQIARQPNNPLFHAALSRFQKGDHANIAASLLLNSPTWPADRLPDSNSACNPWPIMHDYGTDYEPCPERVERYSGGDLLFTAYVLGVL